MIMKRTILSIGCFLLIFTYSGIAQDSAIKVRLSVIMVKNESEARLVLKALFSGADFAKLARQYSVGPKPDQAGDVGYMASGEVAEGFKSALEKLKIGEHSNVIPTSQGYFIIKKTDERSASELEAKTKKEDEQYKPVNPSVKNTTLAQKTVVGDTTTVNLTFDINNYKNLFKYSH